MKNVWETNGYVRITLDKLPDIRVDLVQLDNDWQERRSEQFLQALRKWTERNPKVFDTPEKALKLDHKYHTKDKE